MMIQIEHKATKERQNVASMDGYASADWAQVATLPAEATGDLSLYGAGSGDVARGVEDPAQVERIMIQQIKNDSERRAMAIYSSGRAKMKKYSRKQQEVLDWYALGTSTIASVLMTAFSLLAPAARKRKFRFAIADAALRGDTVADAIARFELGISASEDAIAALEAVEQATVTAIKAASTASSKRAAAAAANWSWSAP